MGGAPVRSRTTIRNRAERAAAKLEAKWFVYIFVFTGVYALWTALAARRPMWFDELCTYYMCGLPSMSVVWSALKDGVELNPPLIYVVTRSFQALFGANELATRLPAMVGFLIMSLCIFQFISRYGSRLAALAAMTFPLITGAYYYAAEARAYGMVLAFTAVAAVCWQSATRNERRWIALPGLTGALAGALLSHCFAVLVLIAFFAGEAAHTISRRKIDRGVLASLVLASTVVLCYVPMLAAGKGYTMNNPVYHASVGYSYQMIFGPVLWPLLAALVILGAGKPSLDAPALARRSEPDIPAHEMVLATGFALAPVFGVLLAAAVGTAFMDRYGLASVIGVGILLGASTATQARGSKISAAAVVFIFAGAFALHSGATIARALAPQHDSNPGYRAALSLPELGAAEPIVIASPLLFLELDHYESRDVADRMYFLTDRRAALRYTGTNLFEAFYKIRKWFPIRSHLEDYHQFLSTHRNFFVLSVYDQPLDWAMRKMVDDGVPMSFKGQFFGRYGNAILTEVSQAGTSAQ